MQMDTVPRHLPRSWHPREPQRAVAVLTDIQIPGADDLLSCKKKKKKGKAFGLDRDGTSAGYVQVVH